LDIKTKPGAFSFGSYQSFIEFLLFEMIISWLVGIGMQSRHCYASRADEKTNDDKGYCNYAARRRYRTKEKRPYKKNRAK
jgi:hypothetical protein